MLGIVIVTHGNLAKELISVAEHVVGRQHALLPVCIGMDDDIELCRDQILAAVKKVESGAGVIILTDMFGGTPSNLSISVMEPEKVEVIAGVNVPMLIKLLSIRHAEPIGTAILTAQEAGRKYINVASTLLRKAQAS